MTDPPPERPADLRAPLRIRPVFFSRPAGVIANNYRHWRLSTSLDFRVLRHHSGFCFAHASGIVGESLRFLRRALCPDGELRQQRGAHRPALPRSVRISIFPFRIYHPAVGFMGLILFRRRFGLRCAHLHSRPCFRNRLPPWGTKRLHVGRILQLSHPHSVRWLAPFPPVRLAGRGRGGRPRRCRAPPAAGHLPCPGPACAGTMPVRH